LQPLHAPDWSVQTPDARSSHGEPVGAILTPRWPVGDGRSPGTRHARAVQVDAWRRSRIPALASWAPRSEDGRTPGPRTVRAAQVDDRLVPRTRAVVLAVRRDGTGAAAITTGAAAG
ncbi:unnamed protein product, partial [Ectocarpus sp. 12 AP-2014]